jgi:hypothetical protein
MRRLILVLTVAFVLVAMMIVNAAPVFAGSGARVDADVNCFALDTNGNPTNLSNDGHSTVTPSGNSNLHCHYHP